MAKRKPTVGEKIADTTVSSIAKQRDPTHIVAFDKEMDRLARRIDRAVRQAFKDGIDCNFYEHSPRIQSRRHAAKLWIKYGFKATPTTRNNEDRDE